MTGAVIRGDLTMAPPDTGAAAARVSNAGPGPAAGAGAGAGANVGTAVGAATVAGVGQSAAPPDRVDIQPLGLAAALQILIAEVRADLPIPADGSVAYESTSVPQALVNLFLKALPEEAEEPATWMAAVTHVQATLELALDKAVATVAAWHDVPQSVADGATQMRAAVLAALGDDPPNPMWLRPEWLGLAPGMARFWRKRRQARRWLSDPDLQRRGWDEDENEPEPGK